MASNDNVFYTRSLGTPAEGIKDQYADGKAAKIWEIYVGDQKQRTEAYRNFLIELLWSKGCRRILDVACGTGVDSVLLVEEGFEVVSVDASDKMLKYALKTRWNRRKERGFDKWVIEEANWLTLYEDIKPIVGNGFDAVICLGNSFAHMMDPHGDQRDQRQALENFKKCVKPGGLLLIDHRNYNHILDTGITPSKSLYYNCRHTSDIKTSILYVQGKPTLVTMDYLIDVSSQNEKSEFINEDAVSEFRLSYYPHKIEVFKDMLKDIFGYNALHKIFGDFKNLNEIETPNYYIHLIEKPLSMIK